MHEFTDFEKEIYMAGQDNHETMYDSEEGECYDLNSENNLLDTEEASETELFSNGPDQPMEIKEQMYQDKLENLKKQLEDLKNGSHPEYLKRIKKLEQQYKERIRLNEIYRDYLVNCVERDYILEKNAAVKEYEEKKTDLRENLLSDMEDKRKQIDIERNNMELNCDTIDIKPAVTRKLRRRPNEPVPVVEKRRKNTPGALVLQLEDKEIDSDLKMISRSKVMTPIKQPCYNMNGNNANNYAMDVFTEAKIEDGKLLYEKRWYHRGQPIFVEGKEYPRFAATISAIGNETIWVKRCSDNNKVRIMTMQLSRGKISIKRRAN
ncbi:sin3 histone deacetylase corepressor complex component SDS3 isoform X1 [Culicoides brevitarsis]|uniref:sin3 histone deacetylase corepressor complex component SDS3 isoform X1 n=1 Tax=Culicoides brevitarsis TaxID=469753 RepID=UPI00307C52F9